MFWALLLLCIVIFIVWKRNKKSRYGKRKKANVRIYQHYNSKDGNFKISGTKNGFKIQKDNDLTFTVVNGQIVSVTDKKNKYVYEVK